MYETDELGPRVGRDMPWEFMVCMLRVQAKSIQSVGNMDVTPACTCLPVNGTALRNHVMEQQRQARKMLSGFDIVL